MEKQISCLAAYGVWGEIRTKGKFKVPMKLKFVQYFFGCIAKITWNHNQMSFVEFLWLRFLSRYSALLDMQMDNATCDITFHSDFEKD